MGLILSLETTTTNCSVSLSLDDKLIALKENKSKSYSHSEKLHLFIEEVFKQTAYSLSDLDALAVSKGPGSYTGLRIGVSAAKGLCFSLDIPLLAIDTLEALSQQALHKDYEFIIPMLDARRMEVYTAVFDSTGKKTSPTEAKILQEDAYQEYLNKGKTLCIGNAVEKFKPICSHKNAFFLEVLPSAKEMIHLAEQQYKKNDIVDVAYFEPYYLKDFLLQN